MGKEQTITYINPNLLIPVLNPLPEWDLKLSDRTMDQLDNWLLHSDKKYLIQNIKTFWSDTNAQTVWLAVYKYNILGKRFS